MSTATQLPIAGTVLQECDFYRIQCPRHGTFNITVRRGEHCTRRCPTCDGDVGIQSFSIGATNREELPHVEGPLRSTLRPRRYRGGRPVTNRGEH